MYPPEKSILVVASEPEMRAVLRQWLERRGVVVHEAASLEAAMRAVFRCPTLAGIICDHRLPDGGAMSFLHWMHEQRFSAPFLLITGRGINAPETSGADVLHTPIFGAALHSALSRHAGLNLAEVRVSSRSSKAGRRSKPARARHPKVA